MTTSVLPARPPATGTTTAYAPTAQRAPLLPLAYLLCGDADRAERAVARATAAPVGRRGDDDLADLRAVVAALAGAPGTVRGLPALRDPVFRAVQRLPWRQRAAVVLSVHVGLAPEQVGAVLHTSPEGVRRDLAVGLARVRAARGVAAPRGRAA